MNQQEKNSKRWESEQLIKTMKNTFPTKIIKVYKQLVEDG